MKAIRALFVAMSLLTVGASTAFASEPPREAARIEVKADVKGEVKGPEYKVEQLRGEQRKVETAYRVEKKDDCAPAKVVVKTTAKPAHRWTEAQRREWLKSHPDHKKGEYRGQERGQKHGQERGKYENGRTDRDGRK